MKQITKTNRGTGDRVAVPHPLPGYYDVKLTVTDDDGDKDSESKTILMYGW